MLATVTAVAPGPTRPRSAADARRLGCVRQAQGIKRGDGCRVAPEGGPPAPVRDDPLGRRRQGVGRHGPPEGDAAGQAPAPHVGIGDEGGVGRHPGEPEADATPQAHGQQEKGQGRGQASQQHAERHQPETQADEQPRVPAGDQVAGDGAEQGAAEPEQGGGGRGGPAGAAELGEQGGQEDREGIGDSGHEQHRGEGKPEPRAGKGLPGYSHPRRDGGVGAGPEGPGARLSRPSRRASWPSGASSAPRPACASA